MSITKEGLFKFQALSEKQRKNLIILETIRKKGPVSKAELSKQSGYNIVTLSNHIDEYIKKGIAKTDGVDVSSGGRKPVLIELDKNGLFLIGIDFSKDAMAGVLTNPMLNVISEVKIPRPAIEQGEVAKSLSSLIGDLIKKSKIEAARIKFAAVGTYGIMGEANGTIKGLDEGKGRSRATIYFKELKQIVEKEFNIRTFFGQDATFAAFGERTQNTLADVDSMLYIFQDIGKGIVIKGEVYCGTDLGSIDIEGLTGSLNEEEKRKISENSAYLRPWNSKAGLKKEALKIIETGVGTKIVELLKGDLGGLSEEVIFKAAAQKDDIAVELIEGIGINLGVRISYLVNLFSPKVVIIGGGIEEAGEILFTQIKKTVEKLSLEKPRQTVKILPAMLGDKAVSLGAASVALREVFLEA